MCVCVQALRTENRNPNCEGAPSQLVGDSFCRLPLCRPAANLPLDCRRSRCNSGEHVKPIFVSCEALVAEVLADCSCWKFKAKLKNPKHPSKRIDEKVQDQN